MDITKQYKFQHAEYVILFFLKTSHFYAKNQTKEIEQGQATTDFISYVHQNISTGLRIHYTVHNTMDNKKYITQMHVKFLVCCSVKVSKE